MRVRTRKSTTTSRKRTRKQRMMRACECERATPQRPCRGIASYSVVRAIRERACPSPAILVSLSLQSGRDRAAGYDTSGGRIRVAIRPTRFRITAIDHGQTVDPVAPNGLLFQHFARGLVRGKGSTVLFKDSDGSPRCDEIPGHRATLRSLRERKQKRAINLSVKLF